MRFPLEQHFRRLYWFLLFNFALFGVTVTLIGATIPKIIETFAWSYTATGFVLAAGSVGYFTSTFLCGFLVQRLGTKRVLVGGLSLQALSLLFFARYPSPVFNLILNFMLGFGQGGSEVVTNFSVLRMERGGESRLMNLMHATFCVGAILGPILLGGLLHTEYSWQSLYRLVALFCLLTAGGFATLSFRSIDEVEMFEQRGSKRVQHRPLLILLFLIILLYVGTELGVSNWIAEYYVKILGTSVSTAAYIVSVFWTGVLLGRLILSFVPGNRHQERTLVMLAGMCTLFLFIVLSLSRPGVTAIFIFLTGLGYSGIYPVVMALIGHYFKRGQGMAVGIVSTGGGIGAFMFPFPIALLAESFGLRVGLLFCAGMNLVLLGLTITVLWCTRTMRDHA